MKQKWRYKNLNSKIFEAEVFLKIFFEAGIFFHPLVRWDGWLRSEASEAESLPIYDDRLRLSRRRSRRRRRSRSASSLESRFLMNSRSRWATNVLFALMPRRGGRVVWGSQRKPDNDSNHDSYFWSGTNLSNSHCADYLGWGNFDPFWPMFTLKPVFLMTKGYQKDPILTIFHSCEVSFASQEFDSTVLKFDV